MITRSAKVERRRLACALAAALGSVSLVVYHWAYPEFTLKLAKSANWLTSSPTGPELRETRDGRRWLWARGPVDEVDGEWFDVTGAALDPRQFQFGLGKDAIRAIDDPRFVAIGDREALSSHDLDDETIVIGVALGQHSKAYPLRWMDRHEVVNDTLGGEPVTVAW